MKYFVVFIFITPILFCCSTNRYILSSTYEPEKTEEPFSSEKISDIEINRYQQPELFINPQNGHTAAITSMDRSDDGQYLITASLDRTVKLWDLQKNALIKTFAPNLSTIISASFTERKNLVAVLSSNKTLYLFHIQTGAVINKTKLFGEIVISYDRKFVMYDPKVTDKSLSYKIVDIKRWTIFQLLHKNPIINPFQTVKLKHPVKPKKRLSFLTMTKDRLRILWNTGYGIIRLQESISGAIEDSLIGHKYEITCSEINYTTKELVTADSNGVVIIWDLEKKLSKVTFESGLRNINIIKLSSDSKFILTCGSKTKQNREILYLWRKNGIQLAKYDRFYGRLQDFCFGANDKIYSAGDEGIIRSWNLHTGKLISVIGNAGYSIDNLVIHNDRLLFFSVGGQNRFSFTNQYIIKYLDLKSGKLNVIYDEHNHPVTKMLLHRNRGFSLDTSGSIHVWNVSNIKRGSRIYSEHGKIIEFHIDRDSNKVIFLTEKNYIGIRNIDNDEVYYIKFNKRRILSFSIDFSRKYIYLGTKNIIYIYNYINKKLIHTIKDYKGKIDYLKVFSKENILIISDEKNNIFVINTHNYNLICRLTGHKRQITDTILLPNNNYLLSSSADLTLKLWNILKPYKTKTYQSNQSIITSLAIDNTSKCFYSASIDGTIKKWFFDRSEPAFTFITFDRNSYVIYNKNNHYFTNKESFKRIFFTKGLKITRKYNKKYLQKQDFFFK